MYKSRYERLLRRIFVCPLNNIATNALVPFLFSQLQQGAPPFFGTGSC
jgi:hypothetical protein